MGLSMLRTTAMLRPALVSPLWRHSVRAAAWARLKNGQGAKPAHADFNRGKRSPLLIELSLGVSILFLLIT